MQGTEKKSGGRVIFGKMERGFARVGVEEEEEGGGTIS